jgi:hypothetical protein
MLNREEKNYLDNAVKALVIGNAQAAKITLDTFEKMKSEFREGEKEREHNIALLLEQMEKLRKRSPWQWLKDKFNV